jgi:tetratricopeptide (TPR) repeat protein
MQNMKFTLFQNFKIGTWSALFLLGTASAQASESLSVLSQIQSIAETEGYAKALRQLDKELPKQGDLKQELLLLKAGLKLNNQQTQDAIDIYKQLIRENPKNLSLYNNLAGIYASQGKLIQAERTLLNGMKSQAELWTAYGNLMTIKGQQAALALQLALDPNKPQNPKTELTPLLSINGVDVRAPQYNPVLAVNPPAPTPAPSVPLPVVTAQAPQSLVVKATTVNAVPPAPPKTPDVLAREESLAAFVKDWAAGWSSGNAERYLSFYSERFIPETKISFTAWTDQRRQRITPAQGIQVQIEDTQVISSSPQLAELTFKQFYVSKSFKARSTKQLTLEQHNGQWAIVRERVIPK